MIKLLVVDDSALMRRQLTSLFDGEPDFEIRTARNGREAIAENLEFQPDVVTLDINMPEMDGLTALSMMMVERPVPVVMVSSLTEKGALATFEALNLGAVDYIVKPGGTISLSIDAIREMLISKVRMAAKARLKPARRPRAPVVEKPRANTIAVDRSAVARRTNHGDGIVVIGVSTGGPRALEYILPELSAGFPWPVLVAQHMPGSFTLSFAQRLNEICALQVVEASRPMPIEPGVIYIGKGGADMQVANRAGRRTVIATPENPDYLWHPSVELLGRSTLQHYPPANILGVMLTGMGNDGAEAFAEIRAKGGRTIAESEESCAVFGMPGELIARGGASVTLHADQIARQLNAWLGC